jgi:uncharacterized protein (DUF952 family)
VDNVIYHLTPAEYFKSLPADKPYLPREFDRDGYIHCTKGEERLLLVADTLYRRVPGDFLALVIDESKITSPVKYENVGGIMFPHIYGALNREAIVRVISMGRRADGTFLPIGEPDAGAEHAAVTEAWLSQARVEQLLAESAALRVHTDERIAQIERAIAALKPSAAAASGQATVPTAQESAEPAPSLEARVAELEVKVADLKSQLSKLKTASAKRSRTTTRRSSAKRK